MKPICWLPPVKPLTCQVTVLFERLLTEAPNCCVVKTETFTGLGVTATDGIAAITVTVAVPDCVVSAWDLATTLTCDGLGTVAGAV